MNTNSWFDQEVSLSEKDEQKKTKITKRVANPDYNLHFLRLFAKTIGVAYCKSPKKDWSFAELSESSLPLFPL
jgi:hypothetical protein